MTTVLVIWAGDVESMSYATANPYFDRAAWWIGLVRNVRAGIASELGPMTWGDISPLGPPSA